ncbi:putative dehydrogenase [Alcanivorax hongdengensis A-11-3]|uniref:Putative dehydrogenase n=1 Tax=Alcanivorax hongdengensis A-11-3 TaxID=1177179 RepID=L0WGJ3_9GAMM|nr:zinc-binding alcohol dehydrogenase family protein [Alcanivorax hongdengensis]EKF74920.1 putative dehydrogenase [Alcanivorax hongdengensis A-11-3]
MKALRFNTLGNLDALRLEECPIPACEVDQARIRVHAAGLNPSDVKNVQGRFPYTTLPRTPGRDFAGVVEDGPDAWLGRAVWGTGRDLGFDRDGSHAQYLTLPVSALAGKPATLSFSQAASCGVPWTTAWDALERSQVRADTRLVILGANGAVGQAALALAHARDARVVAGVRNPEQAQRLRDNGEQTLLLDAPDDLAEQINAHFDGGADVIFDTTGFWLEASVAGLAPFGRIAIIAAPTDGHVRLPSLNLYRRGGSVIGINSLLYSSSECARLLEEIGARFQDGQLPLPGDLTEIPFSDALQAYRAVDSGASGKFIFLMDS